MKLDGVALFRNRPPLSQTATDNSDKDYLGKFKRVAMVVGISQLGTTKLV